MAERAPGDGERGGGHDAPGNHEAFVTMVTSDDFVIGAETMLYSLREHCDKAKTRRRASVVMVTPGVSEMKRQALKAAADEVIKVGGVRCFSWSSGQASSKCPRDCQLSGAGSSPLALRVWGRALLRYYGSVITGDPQPPGESSVFAVQFSLFVACMYATQVFRKTLFACTQRTAVAKAGFVYVQLL